MQIIDGKWIQARLTGERGEKARLAEHLNIDATKLSKILSGDRSVQPEELPKLLLYFNERIVPDGHPDVDKAALFERIDRLNTAGQRMIQMQIELALQTPEFAQQDREPPKDD